ncbi:MAG TPA: saccharopine dehydrogenase NADP-binding domain-containing protein [Kofleriaceae bacterium]|nr:saccharopine dehydrogenase NADP-binding domain-containing protein [Kofleriaceae bacterium]
MAAAAERSIVVYGASGTLGRLVARELADRGARVIACGRDAARVRAVADELAIGARVAAADDPAALASAFAGARVVVSCAGPFGEIGTGVIAAAIDARAAYVDACGEQGFLRDCYERYESRARKAQVACVGGMGVAPALGDLAAALAAEAVASSFTEGSMMRGALPARLAEDDPLDEIAVSWILEGVAAAPGAQRSGVAMFAERGAVWRGDRWDPQAAGASRRDVNPGPSFGGTRTAISAPGGEVITIPRHVAAQRVETFASFARAAWAMRAAQVAARAAPLFGLAARLARANPAPPPTERERSRARFAVVAQATRRFSSEEVIVRGVDLYATAAAIVAWGAVALAAREAGPIGVLAPSELFAPGPALEALAAAADLEIETSFAPAAADAW